MFKFNPLKISLFIFIVGNIINTSSIACCLFAITSILFVMSFFGYISTLTENEKTTMYDKWLSELKLDVKQKMKSKILFAFIGIIIMAMIIFLGLKFNESVAFIVMDVIYFGIFYTTLYVILQLHQKENKMKYEDITKKDFGEKHENTLVATLLVATITTWTQVHIIYSSIMLVIVLGIVGVLYVKHKTIKPLLPDIGIGLLVSIIGFL